MTLPPDPAERATQPSLHAFEALVEVVQRLRKECPWDRAQTHETVRHLIIEEAYEAVDAIERGRYDDLMQELGDLALQIVFHSIMAEEEGRFSLSQLLNATCEKLVRRHPHVYGEQSVDGVDQVLANWEEIKQKERQGRRVLGGVPAHLPALLSAHRMQEKAAGVGFDFDSEADTWAKVEEEVQEFREVSGGPQDDRENEFGDLLFALVNYARRTDINAENALRAANAKFKRRFAFMEDRLKGRRLRDVSLAEMDLHWDAAKQEERAS